MAFVTRRYTKVIAAPRAVVWRALCDADVFKIWAKGFSENAQFELLGGWNEGEYAYFFDPHLGGTKALIETIKPMAYLLLRHVALVNKDKVEDEKSDDAKKWKDCTESYSLTETGGLTTLVVNIETHADFAAMFDSGFAKALDLMQGWCEQQA